MTENIHIYRELQKHLDTLPIGYPATESGVEIKLLKQLYTPEEAKIASKLSFSFESLENIYERNDNKEMSIHDLEQLLDNSVSKGATVVKKEGNKKYYANNMFMIGIYDMQSHRNSENLLEFWEDSSQYFKEGMDEEFLRSGICQFRVIPIEKSITLEQQITSNDDIRKIIENVKGPIVVNDCVCRHKKDVHGEPCKQTNLRETCFVLSDIFSQIYIDQGWGRQISKEEALEIISKTEEDGLVYEIGNSQTPGSLCCCCGCCCGYLSDMKELPKPTEFLTSNYYAELDSEICTGCGTCLDRCQMNALTLVDEISTVNRDNCIGCGACVPTCPTEAMNLRKKEKEIIPPKDWDALYAEILNKK
ncbi:MAG: 4Fe-4S dicluster domain-containing protein [Candidatus Lokiarchaeota archaeon]|nr:4Fe-4S dicluster domain-containing protein [Candidatus Lokiarchaeota archaeon]